MHIDQATKLREIAFESSRSRPTSTLDMAKRAKIIAITSGKGGVGKTNFSVNMAILLAKRGKKVALVDLDFGLANVDILLNVTAPYSLEHLFNGTKKIDDIAVDAPGGFKIIPGGSGLSNLTEINEQQRRFFLENFKKLAADNDYVLFDTAAGIAPNVIQFVLAADEVIVITTDEPTAITDAYAMIKVLSQKKRDVHLNFVLNMVKSREKAKITFKRIKNVVKQFLKIELHDLGHIVADSNLKDAVIKRKPFVLQYPFSSGAKSLKEVAAKILQEENSNKGVLSKFFNFFPFTEIK